MDNKTLISQYVDTGLRIPEHQMNQLSNNNKKTYLRKRIISHENGSELYTYEKLMCLDKNILASLSIKDVETIIINFPHDYHDEMIKNVIETFNISFGDLSSNMFRIYFHYYLDTLNKSNIEFSMDILRSEDFIKKMTPYKLSYILGRDNQEKLKTINLIFSNKDFKDNPYFLECMRYLCVSLFSEEIKLTILEYFIRNVDSRDIKNIRHYLPDYLSQGTLNTSVILNNKKWLYGLSSENIVKLLEYNKWIANKFANDDNILKKISIYSENPIKDTNNFLSLMSKFLLDKDLFEKIKTRCEILLKTLDNG